MAAKEFHQIMVRECPRCGDGHAVEAREFQRSSADDAWTHWYMCPVAQEPAYLHLRTQGKTQLNQEVVDALVTATEAGAYLVTISRVQDNRLYRPFWQTKDFPRGDLETVLEQLRADLGREKAGAMPPAALPTADVPPMFEQPQGAAPVIRFDNEGPARPPTGDPDKGQ